MKNFLFLSLLGLLFTACSESPQSESNQENSIMFYDPHTYAKPDIAKIDHLNLDVIVNFDDKIISGTAEYQILRSSDEDISLILDTRNLEIEKVECKTSTGYIEAKWSLGAADPYFGAPLTIELGKSDMVKITYSTNEGADALQFLDPQQTYDKEHPFLFTQSQAILARTWIPIQDGPGIRFTYNAKVQVPEGLLALMSAENPQEVSANGSYSFKMTQPIPAYLMALSVGKLEYKAIGDRTGVYAEPGLLEASANEFADMQNMLEQAEELYGAYRWEIYDVIVLPPSFPFGGMENPRLTFATPTIIAGDRSLTALIAHELAHSWSGNLVTNANWNDIWLNEGFTVYFEKRIMEKLYGESYANMLRLLSYQDLLEEVKRLSAEGRAADTRLEVELEGRDPDEGLTSIPYDKGALFLTHVEKTVGRDVFDAFLKEYFDTHAFKVMNTESFVKYFNAKLIKGDEELAAKINADAWIFGEGIPTDHPVPVSDRFAKVDEARTQFLEKGDASIIASDEWTSHEWQHFLRFLPMDMGTDKMKVLDDRYNLSENGNYEELCLWLVLAIHNDYERAQPMVADFLITVGRRKFLSPMYKAVLSVENGVERAEKYYESAYRNYHAVSSNSIRAMIDKAKAESQES